MPNIVLEYPAAFMALTVFVITMLVTIVKLIAVDRVRGATPSPLTTALTDAPSLVLAFVTAAIFVLIVCKAQVPEELWSGWMLVLGYFTGTKREQAKEKSEEQAKLAKA